MKQSNEYILYFKGLKEGIHYYDYKLDQRFLSDYPDSEIVNAAVDVNVELNKKATFIIITLEYNGTLTLTCDRCLDTFEHSVNYKKVLYIKFGSGVSDEDDKDIVYLDYNEDEIDLSQFIYEYLVLELPYKKVHANDAEGNSLCNKEMLNKLNKYMNEEQQDQHDPRWNDLAKFLN